MRANERAIKDHAHAELLDRLDLSLITTISPEHARAQIKETAFQILAQESVPLNTEARERVVQCIEDEIMGLGPLEPLLNDPSVSDILVNGPYQVYVERRGLLELTDIQFSNDRHLLNTIDRIVSAVGRRIDESSPMVDARLADGSRVNAIIPPLALDGPVLSIRRFSKDMLGVEDLIETGSMTAELAEVVGAAVRGRMNIIVSGGTGAGKTTMLNLLSGFIPETERIVTIEDSAELQLRQPHVVRLETRPANIEGKGRIAARDLVINSLRMRPERIIVGEVRGGEALDMLQAMNTGHDGSLTTIHANTPRDALSRIENMVSMTGISLPTKALREQIASAIDLVIQIARHEDGKRRIVSLAEINGMEGEIITMSEIFSFNRKGLDEDGAVLGTLSPTGIVPAFRKKLALKGIDIPIEAFQNPDGGF
ncbi:MAG: CpaF family protein [Gammaproteobacteria bacterium]|nr:CpaF family protein [Gammaproteobacteria bacterium]